MTEEKIKNKALMQAENYDTEKEKFAFVCGALFGATETTKELQEENGRLTLELDALSDEVPWKDIIEKNEQVKILVEQIEKMKSDVRVNIKVAEQSGNNQMYFKLNSMINQWELAE